MDDQHRCLPAPAHVVEVAYEVIDVGGTVFLSQEIPRHGVNHDQCGLNSRSDRDAVHRACNACRAIAIEKIGWGFGDE